MVCVCVCVCVCVWVCECVSFSVFVCDVWGGAWCPQSPSVYDPVQ